MTPPPDHAHLWWLADPLNPVWVGYIQLAGQGRTVAFQYAPGWLETGFPLSEDLPLLPQVFLPEDKDRAPGALNDARPDRWGERVIRLLEQPPRLALLDFMLYAGADRFGALDVSLPTPRYAPFRNNPLPVLSDLAQLQAMVLQVARGVAVDPTLKRLLAPGGTMGGAKPKALLQMEGRPWVVKFNEHADPWDTGLVEHATLTLAARCGIGVARSTALPVGGKHAVAVERFDRMGSGSEVRRVHALSADVVLRAAGSPVSYPALAQLLRRLAPPDQVATQMRELFRRMVFNILIDNTDDHEKNHSLLMGPTGSYSLAPAYDVLPTCQNLGYQQMLVGPQGHTSSTDNALGACKDFGLRLPEAQAEVAQIAQVVNGWQAHFRAHGVAEGDITAIATSIDRPALQTQRHV
jgi:serine/threonine-protein kinase HipA